MEDEYPEVRLNGRATLAGKSQPVKHPFETRGGAGKAPSLAVLRKRVDEMDRRTPYSFSRGLSFPFRETIAKVMEALQLEGAERSVAGG